MTKYIVSLNIFKYKKYYTFFGFFDYGEWVKYPYEQQIVFGSYDSLSSRMKEWHNANNFARNTEEKRIPEGHFKYKIYSIEKVEVTEELNQEDIDKMIS